MKLAFKLVSTLILALIVVTAIYGSLAVRREIRVFEEEARADAERLGNALERAVADAWRRTGHEGVADLIRNSSGLEHGMRIRWVWFDAGQGNPYSPMAPPERLTAFMIEEHWTIPAQDPEGNPYLHAYWPVAVDPEREGGLEFSRSMRGLEAKKRELIVGTLSLMVSLVLVTGALAGLLGIRFVGKPLEQLTEKTRRIGEGDLSGPIELNTHDELTELGESLNRMCSQLEQSQATVREEAAARIAAMEQLRHADRLKTVGRLAAGMAHELGTPLNVVSGRAELIASGKLSQDEIGQSAGAIQAETKRMTEIIRHLLDFARRNTPRRAPVNLEQLAGRTIDLMAPLAEEHGVGLSLRGDAGPAVAMLDGDQIQQVLTNLIVNAIQAMPNGGAVKLAVCRTPAKPPEGSEATEGEYYRIDVDDDGEGIAEEDIPHVFEPFFTKKAVGEGTGLGLAIAYGIVQEHGGWIEVASPPEEGSRFSVYLPGESVP